jgi:hypothetical protein
MATISTAYYDLSFPKYLLQGVDVHKLDRELRAGSYSAGVECMGVQARKLSINGVVYYHTEVAFSGTPIAADQTEVESLIAVHDGQPPVDAVFVSSSKVVSGEKAIQSTSWETLGGVVTSPSYFVPDLSEVFARIVGSAKTTGGTIELRFVEENGSGDTVLHSSAWEVSDTSGAWAPISFTTNVAPTEGTYAYRLDGKLGTASSASVRFMSASLLRATT